MNQVKPTMLACAVCLSQLALSTAVSAELVLKQMNPIRKAPRSVNTGRNDGYPWFSNDGRLFLFTRAEAGGPRDVWVTYLKNRDNVIGTADGSALPDINLATPVKLPASINTPDDEKGVAYCQSSTQPVGGVYNFTLFLAAGAPGELRTIYKAPVTVRVSGGEIASVSAGQRIAMGPFVNVEGYNRTEPMLTRDGLYLFWASRLFNRTGASYEISDSPCGQTGSVEANIRPYSQLPQSRFAWKDQYTVAPRTAKTNYHVLLEYPDGRTAIVFEKCAGLEHDRSCECDKSYFTLQTTGFGGAGEPRAPYRIHNGPYTASERLNTMPPPPPGTTECPEPTPDPDNQIWTVTYPTVSGPRGANGSWLIFFTRVDASGGEGIYYTRLKLVSE